MAIHNLPVARHVAAGTRATPRFSPAVDLIGSLNAGRIRGDLFPELDSNLLMPQTQPQGRRVLGQPARAGQGALLALLRPARPVRAQHERASLRRRLGDRPTPAGRSSGRASGTHELLILRRARRLDGTV